MEKKHSQNYLKKTQIDFFPKLAKNLKLIFSLPKGPRLESIVILASYFVYE